MPTWATTAWANRARLFDAAKRLGLSRSTWAALAVLAALGGGLYWAYTTGYLFGPGTWPRIQYVLLTVNVVGFVGLYLLTAAWFRAQDELRDELDQARTQIDDLRVAVYEHEHDIVEAGEEREDEPDTVTAHPAAQPGVPSPEKAATATIGVVRAAPVGEREPGTEEREIGGRVFSFRQG